jgi:hypothetical protein
VFQEHRRLVYEANRVRVFDCMDKGPEDFCRSVKNCRRVLCRTCVKNHVQSQVEQSMGCPGCVADHSRTKGPGGGHPRASLEDLLITILLVIARNLVETLGIDEALLIKWARLEMGKISITVECPR